MTKLVTPFMTPFMTKLVTIVLFLIFAKVATASQSFQVNLKSGSILTVEVNEKSLAWTDVLPDGRLQKRNISLAEIKQLTLSDSPASKQVSEIRKYLVQLESPEYHLRETAEKALANAALSGPFLSLLQAQSEHSNLEVKHRINRVLDILRDTEVESRNEFDVLTLADGSRLEGDAGELNLSGTYRGQPLKLNRRDLSLLQLPTKQAINQIENSAVAVRMFHQHEKEFYQPHQTLVDFEKSPNGDELARNFDVSETFVPLGLRLASEKEGFVGISGYGFKFPLPPANNSVCVFETVGSYAKRFKGVMEIRFCLPGQPSVAAGVHEFGVFVARVNNSRDFIAEAYNAQGQILATVESSDMGCVFFGIKSNEPITFIKILPNPYLFRVTRKVDEDFAIDHVCFSPPIPISGISSPPEKQLLLNNGDLLNSDSMTIGDNGFRLQMKSFEAEIQIPTEEVREVRFGNAVATQPAKPAQRQWLAMLPDRSVIAVEPGKTFTGTQFPELKLPPDRITALWMSVNNVRFPAAEDFETVENTNNVVVFPTARLLAAAVRFDDSGYHWDDAKKIEQELNLSGKPPVENGGDPTPKIVAVDYQKTPVEDIPTLWNQPPKQRAASSGLIRLTDGQQLVLSPSAKESEFELVKLSADGVTIGFAGGTKKIPLDEILSIDLPTP